MESFNTAPLHHHPKTSTTANTVFYQGDRRQIQAKADYNSEDEDDSDSDSDLGNSMSYTEGEDEEDEETISYRKLLKSHDPGAHYMMFSNASSSNQLHHSATMTNGMLNRSFH